MIDIQVTTGELIDKWSILKIKIKELHLDNENPIFDEFKDLDQKCVKIAKQLILDSMTNSKKDEFVNKLFELKNELKETNHLLWHIENLQRENLKTNNDKNTVLVARLIVRLNRDRANIKKEINKLFNDNQEIKEYGS